MNNQKIPTHIAIIMDGNRRWAKSHGLPVLEGHRQVVDKIIEPLIEHAAGLGIKYLTLWAWSTENWKRDEKEVTGIMRLFRYMINKRWDRLHQKGVRLKVIGDISKFAPDIKSSLKRVVEQTKNNQKITAVFALNYGGRDEIIRSIKRLANDVLNATTDREYTSQQFNNLTIQQYNNYLDTYDIPDPELIIRTGGEQRLSGFLLWQSEYSELYFPSWYMPEFTPEKLDEVIKEYNQRQRRFGR